MTTNQQLKEFFFESKKYWEPKRKWYNMLLAIFTLLGIIMIRSMGQSNGDQIENDLTLILLRFFFAFIIANIAIR